MENKGWHVIYVRSQHEKNVDRLLKEQEIESFLPLSTTIRTWSDRKKKIQQPLFPSYVFVNIKSRMDFHQTLSVRGVCDYLKFGDEYAKVSDKEIGQIKCLVGTEDVNDISVSRTSRLNVGEIKKVMYGPLKGLECQILRVKNAAKVIVSISSLRQSITATLSGELLA